jgi:hypothetical protein
VKERKFLISKEDFNAISQAIRSTIQTFSATNRPEDVLSLVLNIAMVDILALINAYEAPQDDCKEYFSESAEKALELYKQLIVGFKKPHSKY